MEKHRVAGHSPASISPLARYFPDVVVEACVALSVWRFFEISF